MKIRVPFSGTKGFWLFLAALAWLLFLFQRFFLPVIPLWTSLPLVFHLPPLVQVDGATRFGNELKLLSAPAAGLWCLGVFWVCGRRLLSWLSSPGKNQPLEFCLEVGLGFFLIYLLWMGLGLTRLWFEPLEWLAALALSLLLGKELLGLPWAKAPFQAPSTPGWVIGGLGAVYFAFLFLHCLLPETFYDSLNYFLGMPDFWLFRHGITDYPTHLLSGYFHGGSLFFMFAYVLAGTEGAKALSALTLGLCVLFAYGWSREKSGKLAGIVAAGAVLTFPLLYLNAWAVRVDGLLAFCLLLCVYSLEKSAASRPLRDGDPWLWMAGLFAGLSLCIKPTAMVTLLAAFLAVLWQFGFPLFKRKSFWFVFIGLALLETGPWFLKNAVFAGNPFFPYATSWMGGRQLTALGYERLLGENRQFLPMDQGLLSVLTLPWRLTMPQAGDRQWIGPLFLAFFPLFFLAKNRDSTLGFFTKTMGLALVLGLCLSHMLRFSMPSLMMALLLFSAVFCREKNGIWGKIWATCVVAGGVMGFGAYLNLSAQYYEGAGIWSGQESQEDYLDRKLSNSYEPLVQWTERNLPQDAVLLIVGDSRGVYYQRTYFAQSAFDEPFFAQAARQTDNAQGVLEKLRQLGVTHVVFNIREGFRVSEDYRQYDGMKPGDWRRLDDFVRLGLIPVYWQNEQAVYEVNPQLRKTAASPPVDPFSFFSPQAHDFFEDFQDRNFPKAESELGQLLTLFPGEPSWLDQKTALRKAEQAFSKESKGH